MALEGCSEEESCKQESPEQVGESDTKSASSHAQLWWSALHRSLLSGQGPHATATASLGYGQETWRCGLLMEMSGGDDENFLEGKIYDKCWVQHRALKGAGNHHAFIHVLNIEGKYPFLLPCEHINS